MQNVFAQIYTNLRLINKDDPDYPRWTILPHYSCSRSAPWEMNEFTATHRIIII